MGTNLFIQFRILIIWQWGNLFFRFCTSTLSSKLLLSTFSLKLPLILHIFELSRLCLKLKFMTPRFCCFNSSTLTETPVVDFGESLIRSCLIPPVAYNTMKNLANIIMIYHKTITALKKQNHTFESLASLLDLFFFFFFDFFCVFFVLSSAVLIFFWVSRAASNKSARPTASDFSVAYFLARSSKWSWKGDQLWNYST